MPLITNKLLLKIACAIEIIAGITWIIAPRLVVPQVIGGELSGTGTGLGRIAGFGLLSLGIGCWPGLQATKSALAGMLAYNGLVTAYLAFIVVRYGLVGKALAPSIVVHGVLFLFLGRAWAQYRE